MLAKFLQSMPLSLDNNSPLSPSAVFHMPLKLHCSFQVNATHKQIRMRPQFVISPAISAHHDLDPFSE